MWTPCHNGHPADHDYAGEKLHVNPWNKLPSVAAVDSRGHNEIKRVDCIFWIWNSDSLVIVALAKVPHRVFSSNWLVLNTVFIMWIYACEVTSTNKINPWTEFKDFRIWSVCKNYGLNKFCHFSSVGFRKHNNDCQFNVNCFIPQFFSVFCSIDKGKWITPH